MIVLVVVSVVVPVVVPVVAPVVAPVVVSRKETITHTLRQLRSLIIPILKIIHVKPKISKYRYMNPSIWSYNIVHLLVVYFSLLPWK